MRQRLVQKIYFRRISDIQIDMNWTKYFNGFVFFWKGMKAAKTDMWASIQVLVVLTLLLTISLYFVEHAAQPEMYTNIGDSIVWGFMSYLDNPDKFSPGEPITLVGRLISIVIAIIKILIFAVPAGLVANGFCVAMAEDKKIKKLNKLRTRIHLAFMRKEDKALRSYFELHKEDEEVQSFLANFEKKEFFFVPCSISAQKIQIRQGINLNDIIATASKFDEYMLKDGDIAFRPEGTSGNNIRIELAPVKGTNYQYGNESYIYGCKIDRKSNITIVATSASDELGTENFAYYLAKFGGFNYVSKSVEACPDDKDSFYIMKDVTYAGLDKSSYREDRNVTEIIGKKTKAREQYLKDLAQFYGENKWMIFIHEHAKKKTTQADLYFVDRLRKTGKSIVSKLDIYESIIADCNNEIDTPFELQSMRDEQFYLLDTDFVATKISDAQGAQSNCFAIRPSSELMNFNPNRMIVAWKLAQFIARETGADVHFSNEEIKDFTLRTCGYMEKP